MTPNCPRRHQSSFFEPLEPVPGPFRRDREVRCDVLCREEQIRCVVEDGEDFDVGEFERVSRDTITVHRATLGESAGCNSYLADPYSLSVVPSVPCPMTNTEVYTESGALCQDRYGRVTGTSAAGVERTDPNRPPTSILRGDTTTTEV